MPALVLAALADVAEAKEGGEIANNSDEGTPSFEIDPFAEVLRSSAGYHKEDLEARKLRHKGVLLWKKAAAEVVFRVNWSTIIPLTEYHKAHEPSANGEPARSDNSMAGHKGHKVGAKGEQKSEVEVPSVLMYTVLQVPSNLSWLELYALAFEEMLMNRSASRNLSSGVIMSDLKRGGSVGNRRELEVRHAIVERLLLLQGVSSALIGLKALFSAL
ncbi:hypothetical protein BWQ96_03484 [Gracilariopsis chorda]|uniref:Uncharacterized protein n=1 Tax=Gracilariopsis chorda TaxID=448386 RepID=A0A2V3IXK2_9FLOR|nr:hypothetical protein BWQ96_03484 [Gracilariopsis chorda]|eukprot:PXF46793.1 hypothetical protein BWQ96_03484 [Gracilariopsis chorda]